MTPKETAAFDSGVLTVLELARRTAESLKPQLAARPTRIGFAVEALEGLAAEGRALLKGAGGGLPGEILQPTPPNGPSGAAARARDAYAPRIPAGDDGNFGLSDAEIANPSRSVIVNWLAGRTPMMASHWSRIAAQMLVEDEHESAITADQTSKLWTAVATNAPQLPG